MTSEQFAVELLPSSEPVRPPKTILIVEDDRSIADVLTFRLQQQGFETVTAGTGAAALAAVEQSHPNLILLDLGLPDTDGFHVCQSVADDPATCETPVIILSGMEQEDVVRRARAAGCRYFLRKPYDPNALLLLIDQALLEAE